MCIRDRCEADVAGYGDLGVDDATNHFDTLFSALNFDGFCAGFFDEAGGVVDGFF